MSRKRKTVAWYSPENHQPASQSKLEKVQIHLHGAEDLDREVQIENALADEKGKKARLNPGSGMFGNVHRHSSSRTESIHFKTDSYTAYLDVYDEWIGSPVERQREIATGGGGAGFRGMRERIAQLGGKF